jgi:nucleotide-binding universal stress UspA family protein
MGYVEAREDFRRARRQAALEELMARLRGRSTRLLSYDEVRRQVGERSRVRRGLQEIPLDAIVGSVGRYEDFTRTFLPRSDSMQERWARVKAVATDMEGWPPIEVYKLGDTYFVSDGNHRVSVARQMGMETIPAYVTEIKTRVPLTPDDDLKELVIKSRRADFLKRTGLDQSRPDAELAVTDAGGYDALEEHIQVHRYYMGLEQQRDISYEEAAAHWYDHVFLPVARVIRRRGLLHDFPDRTETDLYLWLAEHRAELEEALGWEVANEAAADDLASRRSSKPQRVLARFGDRLWEKFTPQELEPGPPAGEWRTRRLSLREEQRLFNDILVAINGQELGWRALEQAIVVAQREGSHVRGLHVVPEGEQNEEAVREIRDRFEWRMGEVGLKGTLVVEEGRVPYTLCDRARWNDLLVMPLTHPPGTRVAHRLSSGFRSVVQRCPRPMLAVPGEPAELRRPLLAYDGSAKAREALFIVTYLAARWDFSPVVLTVVEEDPVQDVVDDARAYLEQHGVEATYEVRLGDVVENMLGVADVYECDYIALGGYGARPVIEIVLGSELNQLLRTSPMPTLICR